MLDVVCEGIASPHSESGWLLRAKPIRDVIENRAGFRILHRCGAWLLLSVGVAETVATATMVATSATAIANPRTTAGWHRSDMLMERSFRLAHWCNSDAMRQERYASSACYVQH